MMVRRRKRERERRTTVHDLPDECLALVFPFLTSKADRNAASLTCRRWRTLDALSRHSLHLSYLDAPPEDEWPDLHLGMLRALQVFPHILSLSVLWFHSKIPDFFLTLFQTKALAQLQSVDLDVGRSQIDDTFVQCVAVGCPALRCLGISMCKVTDAGLSSLAQACRHLKSVDVSYCSVTDKGIDVLLTMCPNMEVLCVTDNLEIEGWGFRHGKRLRKLKADSCFLTDTGFVEGLQGATALETLDLDCLTVDIEALEQGCPTLAAIGVCCKLLVELHLTCSALDDFSLREIACGCLNLKVLEVDSCSNVTFVGWQAVALSCLNLEVLNVQGCDQFYEDSFLAIFKGCPSLAKLKIPHRFFPSHSVFKLFKISRPTVDITFYDNEGNHYPLDSS